MLVKYVDDGNYFVELDGPAVTLRNVSALSSAATVQVTTPGDIDDGDYFVIYTPTQDFYVWMDKSGDGSADPSPTGFDTDSPILVDISAAADADAVATAIQSAVDGTSGLSASVNSDGDVELDVDDTGACSAPEDYNTGFTFSDQLDGEDSGGLVKEAVPNDDSSVVEVYDATYDSATDTLEALCRVKKTVSLGKDVGSKTTYSVESQTVSDFVLG